MQTVSGERAQQAAVWLRRLGIDPDAVTEKNLSKVHHQPPPRPLPPSVDPNQHVLFMGWGVSVEFEGVPLGPSSLPKKPGQKMPIFLPGQRVIIPGKLDQALKINVTNKDIVQGVQIDFNGVNLFSGQWPSRAKPALSASPLNYHALAKSGTQAFQSWKGIQEFYRLAPVSNGHGILAFGSIVFHAPDPLYLIQTPEYRKVIDAVIANASPNTWREAPDVDRRTHKFPWKRAVGVDIDTKLTQLSRDPNALVTEFTQSDPRLNATMRGYKADGNFSPIGHPAFSAGGNGGEQVAFYVVDESLWRSWLPPAPDSAPVPPAATPAAAKPAQQPPAIPGMSRMQFGPFGADDVDDNEIDEQEADDGA